MAETYSNDTLIRDLPIKYGYTNSDYMIVEGLDGTKIAPLGSIIGTYVTKVLFFDNLSDLQDSNDLTEGVIVSTMGYHYKGDGGGATYLIGNGLPYTANDSTIIQLHASTTLKAFLVMSSDMYVEQFGARGDSITDDSNAFKYAFTNCDIIRLNNNRKYLISSPVSVKSSSIIYGNNGTIVSSFGTALLFENCDNNSVENLNINITNIGDGLLFKNCNNLTLVRIRVNDIADGKNGLTFKDCNNIYINGVSFNGTNDSGCGMLFTDLTLNKMTNITINNCIFNEVLDCIHLSSQNMKDVFINKCSFYFNNNTSDGSKAFQLDTNIECNISNCVCTNGNLFIQCGTNSLVDVNVDNVYIENTLIGYSIPQRNASIISLNGKHRYHSDDTIKNRLVLYSINGSLVVNTSDFKITNYKEVNTSYINTGVISDIVNPESNICYNRKDVTVVSSNRSLTIDTFRNTVIDIKSETGFGINSISKGIIGQIILLVSSDDLSLPASGYGYEIESDIVLHKYKGVKLVYTTDNIWKQI